MLWWLLKYLLLGPVLRLLYRPRALGLENVPDHGGALLAPNHLSALDTLLFPLVVPGRRVVLLGKAELFRWYSAWFFRALGVIPVPRSRASSAEEALRAGATALRRGELIGIFPEGTRSPDGRLYRGRTGAARMALQADVPVIPIGIVGTRRERGVRRRGHIEIRFGRPLDFRRYRDRSDDRFIARAVADEVMYEIMALTGQEYVDDYAAQGKERREHTGTAQPRADDEIGATASRHAPHEKRRRRPA